MRLLLVELGRFRSRRGIVVVLLLATLVSALLVLSATWSTRPVDAADRAAAEQSLAQETEAMQSELARCERRPELYLGDGGTAADCRQMMPTLDWFLSRPQLDLRAELDNRGILLVGLLVAAAIVVGATFSGADWATGSMSNQLLFVPRRTKVWAAKATAVVLGTTVVAALVLALFWAVLHVVADARSIVVSAETTRLVLEQSGRGLGLVAAAALGGFALTMLLRHTVATLGLLFAYAVVGEGLAASLPIARMSQWSLPNNILAWVQDGTRVYDESICDFGQGGCDPFYSLSLPHAATYLGLLLLLAVTVSVASFRRRDVP